MDCLFRVKTVTLETANVTNCHVIATDILFLSSNHRSVQFLYLAASHRGLQLAFRSFDHEFLFRSRPQSRRIEANIKEENDAWRYHFK